MAVKRRARTRRANRRRPVTRPAAEPTSRVASRPTSDEQSRHAERIKGLSEFLGEIGSREADLTLLGRSQTPLYHYTNLDGLKGIVENHDLWLTHARYSNDEREITLGLGIAREVVELLKKSTRRKAQHAYFDRLLELLDPTTPVDAYICCFCEADDRLSQWRAYGGDGNGVSLEVVPADFAEFTGYRPAGVLSLWKVHYQRPKQLNLMREAVEWTFRRYGTRPPAELAAIARRIIDFFIPTFKDAGFSEEAEWRLIFVPVLGTLNPHFRVARGMMTRYYGLKELVAAAGTAAPTWRLPIHGVRIGPSPHKVLNSLSTVSLLVSAGYEGVRVEQSLIAYRGA